jgi:hypothetical protein
MPFEVRDTRLRTNSRSKPKFCSSRCYGKARTLSVEERKARKKKRNRDAYLRRKASGRSSAAPAKAGRDTPEHIYA